MEERNYWIEVIFNKHKYDLRNFVLLLWKLPEYRSVFYHRLGKSITFFLRFLARNRITLQIDTSSQNIGVGFVVQHGFSTIVNAKYVGEFVQVWQNVTIGTNRSHSGNIPIIGNHVKISVGAIVIGNIKIGNNVIIGAGAVVTKSVPDNCVVVGNPAYIIKKQHGKNVKIPL